LLVAAPRLKNPSETKVLAKAPREVWRPRRELVVGLGVALLAVLVLAPEFVGLHLVDWTRFLAYTVLFLSLGLLVKMSGQVSLGHVSFMAIGVVAFSKVAVDHSWPWVVALLFAAVVAAPIGAVLAIPAIRFPGLYLALATLGFGLLLQQMFYNQSFMFGQAGVGVTVPRPDWRWLDVAGDRGYYYLVLVIAVAVGVLVILIGRSRLGRLLQAMADSSVGLASAGASINVSRVLVFCISASLAAVAGVLDAGAIGLVGADAYQPLLSLQLFCLVMLAFGGVPWFAVIAAFAQVLLPVYITTGDSVTYVLTLLFGVGAVAMATRPLTFGALPEPVRRLLRPLGARPTPVGQVIDLGGESRRAGGHLAIDDVTVRFGGLVAADGVSLDAQPGRVTALIGPNGAGKSTVFNVCSGYVRPVAGQVSIRACQVVCVSRSGVRFRGVG
jgi:ABC-type branched-subunit amino acid transport system permease subunit